MKQFTNINTEMQTLLLRITNINRLLAIITQLKTFYLQIRVESQITQQSLKMVRDNPRHRAYCIVRIESIMQVRDI